jgi:hypothetical protein
LLAGFLWTTACKQKSSPKIESPVRSFANPTPTVSPALKPAVPEKSSDASAPRPSGPITFTDITAQAGIHFKHNSGAFGKKYLPETMGSGVCFIDYDNDGWQDILLVNSMDWPGHNSALSQ